MTPQFLDAGFVIALELSDDQYHDAAHDHWTGLRTAENVIARQMAQASDPNLVPGTSAFLDKVGAIASAHSPELTQRATELRAGIPGT